jgi:protein phosphatase
MRTSPTVDPLESTWPRPLATPPVSEIAAPALSAASFGLTDTGRERRSNEDRFLIASPVSALWMSREGDQAKNMGYGEITGDLFAVADGIGGHTGGAQASALAIETMSTFFLSTLKWVFALGGPDALGADMLDQLQSVLRWADSRVREEAARTPDLRQMGSTLTIAYRYGSFLYVGHVGDSRCYLLRGGALHQITHDHTLVGEMVRQGLVTREDAEHHPARHVITNALGGVTPDLRTEVHRLRVRPGDVLLLCTDGLTEMASEKEIAAIVQRSPSPRDACENLVQRANDCGGVDNVTVIVARYEAEPTPPRPVPVKRRGVLA